MTTTISPLPKTDPRLEPLFTVREAASFLGVRHSTFQNWTHGYRHHKPVVLKLPAQHGHPNVPFIGLAEGMVLAAFRQTGVPLQRIRPAIARLDKEIGLQYALASKGLYSDGAEVLYDYAAKHDVEEIGELVVVRNQQKVFVEIVRDYLRRISYASDGWAEELQLPGFGKAHVVVTLRRGFGRPILDRVRVRVEDVQDRWNAGDGVAEIAEDFGLTVAEVEDVIRAATRTAA
jgi:uncharacterized protein (DUF433 family)